MVLDFYANFENPVFADRSAGCLAKNHHGLVPGSQAGIRKRPVPSLNACCPPICSLTRASGVPSSLSTCPATR